jgi:hypothetical protein
MFRIFRLMLPLLLLLPGGCGKTTQERSRLYNLSPNASYAGVHPVSSLSATVYVRDRSSFLEFQTDLRGVVDSLQYNLRIHEADTSEPFGYKPAATISLGTYKNNTPVITQIAAMYFNQWVEDFKGYFVVQDPYLGSADTGKLLFFSKLGGGWE